MNMKKISTVYMNCLQRICLDPALDLVLSQVR